MTRVDAHTHVHPSAAAAAAFRSLVGSGRDDIVGDVDDAFATMDRYGVETMVLLPILIGGRLLELRVAELGGGRRAGERARAEVAERWSEYNSWARSLARAHPGRFVALVGLDPVLLGPDWTTAEVERGLAEGARGLKFASGVIGCPPDDPRMDVLWELADRHALPVVAQSGTAHFSITHPDRFEAVLRAHHRLKLILAHAGVGAEERTVELAAAYPNLFVDTSTWFQHRADPASELNRSEGRAPYELDAAADFFRRIGIERVLLGTNFGLHDPAPTHEGVRTLPLDEHERALVLGENATRVFGVSA